LKTHIHHAITHRIILQIMLD